MQPKLISDLDELLQVLITSLRPDAAWARGLRTDLAEAGMQVQILRMTLSLRKSPTEVAEAAQAVAHSLRGTAAVVSKSRADATTRAAVLLASNLASTILKDANRGHDLQRA